MKRALSVFFLIAWLAFTLSLYAETAVVRLKDGTTLRGEILDEGGAAPGVYKINTTTLGVLSINAADIVAVQARPVDKWQEYQEKIVNSPETMASIQDLSGAQEVADMLADKEVKDAIMRQDIEYLKNNEKFMKFVNNPTVQQIIQNSLETEKKN